MHASYAFAAMLAIPGALHEPVHETPQCLETGIYEPLVSVAHHC